jgi:dsRNA-specific ribonuclease
MGQQTPDLQRLQQQVLCHTFSNYGLLQQALTHVSRAGCSSYQRLEFLGDAVLDLYVSSWLMVQLGQALQQQADAAGR